jgi:hypothetical protein
MPEGGLIVVRRFFRARNLPKTDGACVGRVLLQQGSSPTSSSRARGPGAAETKAWGGREEGRRRREPIESRFLQWTGVRSSFRLA